MADMQMAWQEIRSLLGPSQVMGREEALNLYGSDTIGLPVDMQGVIYPKNHFEVVQVVQIANRHRLPLYAISTGKNWGYGGALPSRAGLVIVDLSRMQRIIKFDRELGYVELEPGVTQGQLYDFLKENGHDFLVPTTGAGPNCSILGNAMERGYGITPYEDHFQAVLSLRAVLPNGEIYSSSLQSFGGYRSDAIFRWKTGPYLEGLFTQGNVGIVTSATIALAPKPESVAQIISFLRDEDFEEAIQIVQKIRQRMGGTVGGINLMSMRRVLAMMVSNQLWRSEGAETEMHIRYLAKKHNLHGWTLLTALYGTNEMVQLARREITAHLKPIAIQTHFLNRQRLKLGKMLLGWHSGLRSQIESAERALSILEGQPSEVALQLAYLKNTNPSLSDGALDPGRDGCGLIWYAPLIPMEAPLVRDFAQEVTRICISMDVDPLITFTSLSERCFDSTIPILFDKSKTAERDRALQCFHKLLEMGASMGVFPYRLDIHSARKYYQAFASAPSVQMAKKIKDALDPNGILSPGRYSV